MLVAGIAALCNNCYEILYSLALLSFVGESLQMLYACASRSSRACGVLVPLPILDCSLLMMAL
jgi:hypothetical protein